MLYANVMATTLLVHPGRPLCTIILANRPLLKVLFAGIYVLPINNLLSAHESWFLWQTHGKTP